MKPGREMDAIIAEKVLGHKIIREPSTKPGDDYWEESPIPPDGVLTRTLLHYSTSIYAAFKVFEWLCNLRTDARKPWKPYFYKPVVRLEVYEHDDCYRLDVGRVKGFDPEGSGSAGPDLSVSLVDPVENEPRETYMERATCFTICLAALKAAEEVNVK